MLKFPKILLFISILFPIISCENTQKDPQKTEDIQTKIGIVIHGGAGTIKKELMDAETQQAYEAALNEALQTAYQLLENGGSSCDAVMAAITLMEDSPLFNAGKGAVFTADGKNELDASIMRGHDLAAGSIAGVTTVKNPIKAAYAVMTASPHVMLAREGAEAFALETGLEIVEPEYFYTERRAGELEKIKRKVEKEFGTVGAVAVDQDGNICAGTSTGGMTNKKWGRIGDSPIIGAGTYANNESCGVSCTGHGEYYIRLAAAHDVSALMQYQKLSVKDASETVIQKLTEMGATGGLIALDRFGNVSTPFNTPGMYRGHLIEGDSIYIGMYRD